MEERKIIGFGKDSFVVSLPKKWVRNNNLKKGDAIFVKQSQNELLLTPSRLPEETITRETVIDVEGKDVERIKSEIMTAYLNNSDVIEVKGKMPQHERETIKDFINYLAGLEIFEIESGRIVARDIVDFDQVPIHNFIKRVDMNVRSMLKEIVQAIDGKDTYADVFERDKDINRLVYLAYRVIKRAWEQPIVLAKTDLTLPQLYIISLILMRLEKIGDQAKRVARICKDGGFKPAERIMLKKKVMLIAETYDEVMKAYYNKDFESSYEMGTKCAGHIRELAMLENKHKTMPFVLTAEQLKNMLSSIRHISQNIPGGIG